MPEVISLLTHLQGKSAGFTTKPFTNYPNKLVAARFQQLGEWSPPSRLAHLDGSPVHILTGKKSFCNLGPPLVPKTFCNY
jgi:hypothetical protein